MVLPARHLFKVVKTAPQASFDFRFQYRIGPQESVVPIDLTHYTASWHITSLDGLVTYATYSAGGTPGTSGVFFGGDTDDPTTGIIDLIIVADDIAQLPWTKANYMFTVTPQNGAPVPLLTGQLGVIGTLD